MSRTCTAVAQNQAFHVHSRSKKVQKEHVNKILSKLWKTHKIITVKKNSLHLEPFKWNVLPWYAGHWFIENREEKLNISGGIYQEKLSYPKAFINLICRVSTTIKGPTKVVCFKADVKRSMQIASWITMWEEDSPFYHMEWELNYFVSFFWLFIKQGSCHTGIPFSSPKEMKRLHHFDWSKVIINLYNYSSYAVRQSSHWSTALHIRKLKCTCGDISDKSHVSLNTSFPAAFRLSCWLSRPALWDGAHPTLLVCGRGLCERHCCGN